MEKPPWHGFLNGQHENGLSGFYPGVQVFAPFRDSPDIVRLYDLPILPVPGGDPDCHSIRFTAP